MAFLNPMQNDPMQYVTGFNPNAPLPPAVAARQRKDKKRDAQRKIGAHVMDQQAGAIPAANVTPPPASPPPSVPTPQNIGFAPGGKPVQEQPDAGAFPTYQAPEYHQPAKGLEYLALGLGLLFPGAPIASAAAGFAAGLGQRSQNRYERDQQNAQATYQSQIASYQNQQTEKEQDFLKTIGPPPERKKDESEDQYQAELSGYYDKATVGALHAGLPDLAAKLAQIQTHAATAGLDITKGSETLSRIPLNQARATYYQKVLGVNLEIAKEKVAAQEHIAAANVRARMQAAAEEAASRIQVAQIGASSREDVAQLQSEARLLGQYYAITTKSSDQAAKLAADRVNSAERNAEQYAAAYGRATGNWNVQGANGPSITLAPSFVVGGQPPGAGGVNGGLLPLPGGKWGMYNPQTGQITLVSIGNNNQPPPKSKQPNSQAPRTGPVPPGGYDPLNPASLWSGVPTTHNNPGKTGLPQGSKPVATDRAGKTVYQTPTNQYVYADGTPYVPPNQ